MSDTISRQAAIDAIRASTSKYTGFMEMEMYTDDDAVEAIEALPSADRPQGWVDKAINIIDAMQKEGIIDYEQAWEFRMRARMKGADDE